MFWREKIEGFFRMLSGSKHALDGLRETWNSCVLTLLAPQTTLSWSLSLIWNRQGTWFGLLRISPFANLGKLWFCKWGRFCILRSFCYQVDFLLLQNTICNMFGDYWDQIGLVLGLGEWKCKICFGLVWFANKDEPPCLNQGQMKLDREFCLKFVPNVPLNFLGWMKKRIRSKGFVVRKWQCGKVMVFVMF